MIILGMNMLWVLRCTGETFSVMLEAHLHVPIWVGGIGHWLGLPWRVWLVFFGDSLW